MKNKVDKKINWKKIAAVGGAFLLGAVIGGIGTEKFWIPSAAMILVSLDAGCSRQQSIAPWFVLQQLALKPEEHLMHF